MGRAQDADLAALDGALLHHRDDPRLVAVGEIVLETDAPDIPPHWLYRTAEQRAEGEPQGRNEPGELPRIGAELAALRGISVAELAQATTRNAVEALPRPGALIGGQTYQFAINQLGLESMVLDLRSAKPGFEFRFQGVGAVGGTSRMLAPIGLDGRLRTTDSPGGRTLATKANWVDGQTLAIVSHAIGEGEVTHYTLRFGDGTVDVLVRHNSGFKTALRGVAVP